MSNKFGWVIGVLVRCLLNIFGVMLFLRISWVVAQAGIGLASIIILLASAVTTLTALSMSAISTNGEVKGGGAYYMISRTLGPEFGGAIGIIFALANAVAVAMYVVGFAETIVDMLKNQDMLFLSETNVVRVIGLITAALLLGIALAGLDWEARAQLVLLAILSIAIGNVIIGSVIPPSEAQISQGFVGYTAENFKENFIPDYRDDYNFFTAFAIYFPAATGILAGANISGDLRDPQMAIPKGTLLAIIITTIIYLLIAWITGLCVKRDANGIIKDMISSVTQLISIFGPITVAGIFSATLSSALASLISAPKVFQAVCKDKIFPFIGIFGKGYGKTNEPRRAYLLTFIIGAACICIGDLNSIAPLISNFFLASYALICYSCADASLAKSPGWRPAFKYYSVWTGLAGTVLCVVVMFIMNWSTALITFAIIAILYFYVHYRKPDINWGSSTQAHVCRKALQLSQKLIKVSEHIKNFRPQILVLTGFPASRPALVDLCSNICKDVSLMLSGHVVVVDSHTSKLVDTRPILDAGYRWLLARKSKSFYSVVTAPTLRAGVQALLQASGVGKLRPNTLVLGFKNNWKTSTPEDVENYFNIIHDAFDFNLGVGILRMHDKLDYSYLGKPYCCEIDDVRGDIGDDVRHEMDKFNIKKQQGYIDVWWLFDDGGLTLLIPYLLSMKKKWNQCKLRIFMAGTHSSHIDQQKRQMSALLTKFRIDFSSMIMIADLNKKPEQQSLKDFDSLISDWMLDEMAGETIVSHPWKITESELLSQKDKTHRNIRLRELLKTFSIGSTLVFVTLPMPRKGVCSAGLYMAWIDTLTRDMPPMMLLRGNQESVLTYYS
ncbi:hypothetical protein HELRODRAFT_157349 [Helobdella robusta]|uniref:Amino acid permease/ SLC12A domain-containing protein n=1 Tax=Helobdella robusta TaxID=6412 RepID=T1EMA0_HELRO|nr:hypothetical protein HELRODRAFT_157349 [Helobdella robusta]ESO00676.1 hypothetical protein HELRODRAFT_157349 [Helobdella robusta]